jgi:hypothetical protein
MDFYTVLIKIIDLDISRNNVDMHLIFLKI